MSPANNQNRIALLDGLVRFHVSKFIKLEAKRAALFAEERRAAALIELQLIEARLSQLTAVLR